MSILPSNDVKQMTITEKSHLCNVANVMLTIIVVLAHVCRMYSPVGAIPVASGPHPILDYLTWFFYSFHMPAFVAVSGAVFYLVKCDLNKYGNSRKFFQNKACRLLIPYFAFLFLVVTPCLYHVGILNDNLSNVILRNVLFMGDSRHLWFLPMLFGCFAVIYTFHSFFHSHQFLALVVSFSAWLLSTVISLPIPVVGSVAHYFIFFYLGYLILRNIDHLRFVSNPVFIVSALLIIALLCLAAESNQYLKFFLSLIGIFACFGLAINLGNIIDADSKWFISLRNNSFGIYLFHPMIIYLIFNGLNGGGHLHPILFTMATFLIAVSTSFLLSAIIRRHGTRALVGELKI